MSSPSTTQQGQQYDFTKLGQGVGEQGDLLASYNASNFPSVASADNYSTYTGIYGLTGGYTDSGVNGWPVSGYQQVPDGFVAPVSDEPAVQVNASDADRLAASLDTSLSVSDLVPVTSQALRLDNATPSDLPPFMPAATLARLQAQVGLAQPSTVDLMQRQTGVAGQAYPAYYVAPDALSNTYDDAVNTAFNPDVNAGLGERAFAGAVAVVGALPAAIDKTINGIENMSYASNVVTQDFTTAWQNRQEGDAVLYGLKGVHDLSTLALGVFSLGAPFAEGPASTKPVAPPPMEGAPSTTLEFSGGMPALEGTPYSPDAVNARSAQFYSLYGDNPVRGTMSNVDARQWYLGQDARIPESLDPSGSLEDQARQAFDLRNANRTDARELMSDRITADRLYREDPNWTWGQMIDYRRASGLSDQQTYQSIIESSQKTRASVNKQLGLE